MLIDFFISSALHELRVEHSLSKAQNEFYFLF